MVNCEKNDDFIEIRQHLFTFVAEDSVVHRKHQIELIDVHAKHQLCPGIDLKLNNNECYQESSCKVKEKKHSKCSLIEACGHIQVFNKNTVSFLLFIGQSSGVLVLDDVHKWKLHDFLVRPNVGRDILLVLPMNSFFHLWIPIIGQRHCENDWDCNQAYERYQSEKTVESQCPIRELISDPICKRFWFYCSVKVDCHTDAKKQIGFIKEYDCTIPLKFVVLLL